MTAILTWYEMIVAIIPLPLLEVLGRFSYIVGLFLAFCAFGGFTFRIGNHWGFGRTRQTWNVHAFLSVPLTFVLIIASGYIGSFIVLVPGAQTFESLKDLVVLLSIVLLGYPALITIPFAYGLSDLIEGVPPEFLLAWLPGYFINPSYFWIAYQFIGKNPDFRMGRTWWRYLAAAVLFMALEPVLWGYVCSDQFPSGISYHSITPALLFTTSITWAMGPVAFLAALPLAKRFGWFWAEIPGHVRERAIGSSEWIWEAGHGETRGNADAAQEGLPIRIFIFSPFIALVLVMVGATAVVALRSADDDAAMLATKLHHAMSVNIGMRLDDYRARSLSPIDAQREDTLVSLLQSQAVGTNGRAFILDRTGKIIASSAPDGDPVVQSAVAALARHAAPSGQPEAAIEFQFDHVTEKPLSRETWLTYATPYGDDSAGRDWIVVTAMPEAFYLAGVRVANSRSAMMFALALVFSLVLAAALASMVTAPLRRMANATRMMARGDLSVRVKGSKLEELGALAATFNDMAAKLKKSFDDLVGEVEMRKSRERELQESEARLRASEERWRLVFENSTLGIMLTDHDQKIPGHEPGPADHDRLHRAGAAKALAGRHHFRGGTRRGGPPSRRDSHGQAGQLRGRDALSAKGRLADLGQHVRLDHSGGREQPADLYCHRHRHHRPAQGGKRTAAVRNVSRRSREAQSHRLLGHEFQDRRAVLVPGGMAHLRPPPGNDAAFLSGLSRSGSSGRSRRARGGQPPGSAEQRAL